ncbi:MAG: ABC transporter substrate-binding protein [Negativibacillus sp.]|nr:ABC transporter substrate-binding protein [Negativibacillus sp.]
MKKKILALMLAAAMAMSMVACGSGDQGTAQKPAEETKTEQTTETKKEESTEKKEETPAAPAEEKDTFTVAISYMPDQLSPASGGSDDYTSMTRPLFDRLYMENNDGGIDYYMAESLDISEDGKTYTLKIRDDVKWSDGTPVTTKDIQFAIDFAILRYGRSSVTSINGNPVEIQVVDDKTMTFTLPEPYAYYIVSLSSLVPYPYHVFDGDAQKMLDDVTYYTKPGFATTGPYVVSEINEDSVVYTARDDYYRGTPSVKKVVMKVIGSGSTKAIAFENGEIDYMRLTTVDELEKYEAQSDKYNIYSFSEARLNYLQVNPYGPANLNDEQREALFYAINGDEVIDGAYGSDKLATNPNSILTPDISLYDPETPDYVYDLEKAKELAKSSGLEGMTLTYIYNADRPNMEAVAVVLQQQLSQIGVTLQIEGMDSSSFFPRFFAASSYGMNGQEKTWDLGTNGWDSMRGRTLNQAYSYLNQTNNAWGLTPTCGELAYKVNTCTDPEQAKAKASEVVKIALDQHRIYPLTYTNYIIVSQKNVTGLDKHPIVPEFADYLDISVNG